MLARAALVSKGCGGLGSNDISIPENAFMLDNSLMMGSSQEFSALSITVARERWLLVLRLAS
jgi:hypothetical protein